MVFILVSDEDEIDRTCGTPGRQQYFAEVWWKNLEKSDYLEDLEVDGNII
jgi:hypothetical protein